MSALVGTGASPMPSSPGDLKPAHISPPPPASIANSNNHISSSSVSQKVCPQTLNGVHSPNNSSNTNGTPTSSSNSSNNGSTSTPSPPNAHAGSNGAVSGSQAVSAFGAKSSPASSNLNGNAYLTQAAVAASANDLSFASLSSNARHISKLKRFLTSLYQFTCDISADAGERAHSLIISLASSTITIEEFCQKIQELTHYPLRPYVVPFLKIHLPILQNELIHFSRLFKLSVSQYIKQHESMILETMPAASSNFVSGEPFDIFQPNDIAKEAVKRRPSPEVRKENGYDGSDAVPPAKRHQPMASSNIASRLSPGNIAPALLHSSMSGHNASILHSHLSSARSAILEEAQRERETPATGLYHIQGALRDAARIHNSTADHFTDRFSGITERYEKELFGRPNSTMFSELQRGYNEDVARDMEEEWKNIDTMLNCILGMVEKTKRAVAILQQRNMEYASSTSPISMWSASIPFRARHFAPSLNGSHAFDFQNDLKKAKDQIMSGIHYSKPTLSTEIDRVANISDPVRRQRTQSATTQIEEAVNEVKRQAVAEMQKAVSAAESKANEFVAVERAKMERILSEARRQAAEDALAAISHQEDSTEVEKANQWREKVKFNCGFSQTCWNCGRKASETCSGCNVARYCGSFCQHKDWEHHHKNCGQNRENANTANGTNANPTSAIPSTIADIKLSSKVGSPTPSTNSSQPANGTSAPSRIAIANSESREKSSEPICVQIN
ncbi:protein CBFA2T1-like protein [Dinothrombium tinctorium]|uniref:Protein CBFA2T1-like protein n=1 Tax=Dinothrombium tinctorium TaxID=1965070 RepID=A0A3S4RES1_9ACAR|nr:protein CBFA2T1-like protein [Dinothrombium tinctorium]RWS15285.1 protein CBFA2T1-like protein [Dinothrombium tinctorium]RWS15591.1 protein CBFA2T1-like protein [Dinothrombium tinctorium]